MDFFPANLDEAEDLLEFETLFRLLPGRLDERIDEERILGDALRDKENALWDALLLAQRIQRALAGESGKFAILLDHLLVHGHRLLVAAAKFAVQRAQLVAEQTRELDPQNVLDGRHDRLLTLALPQAAQELQVVLDQLLQAREDPVDRLRTQPHLPPHSFGENLNPAKMDYR